MYLRVDLGSGAATFFVYERSDEGYFDAVRGGGSFNSKPSLSKHCWTRPDVYYFRDS